MIARALARKPNILILDEATNAIDNTHHSLLQNNLSALHITRIIIAHRPHSINLANRVYEIREGKIIMVR